MSPPASHPKLVGNQQRQEYPREDRARSRQGGVERGEIQPSPGLGMHSGKPYTLEVAKSVPSLSPSPTPTGCSEWPKFPLKFQHVPLVLVQVRA